MGGQCTKGTLGVIGGMGVQATARFYTLLTDMQAVATEQEYIDMLIYSKPSIPNRTAFITGESDISPFDSLLDVTKKLEGAGVSCIVMPCVTAHFFYEELARSVKVPFINMMEATAQHVKKVGCTKVGLLATEGTLKGRLFHDAFNRCGVDVVLPAKKAQARMSEAIYNLKRGKMPLDALEIVSWDLYDTGAEAIVLGCTELGLLQRYDGYLYIEAMEVLAHAALRAVQTYL